MDTTRRPVALHIVAQPPTLTRKGLFFTSITSVMYPCLEEATMYTIEMARAQRLIQYGQEEVAALVVELMFNTPGYTHACVATELFSAAIDELNKLIAGVHADQRPALVVLNKHLAARARQYFEIRGVEPVRCTSQWRSTLDMLVLLREEVGVTFSWAGACAFYPEFYAQ
jgi:hypothetical protein